MLKTGLGVGERSFEADPIAGFASLQDARPASVLSDSSPLRWRFGERLDDVLDEACRRFADRDRRLDRRRRDQLPRAGRAREPDGAVPPRPRRQARRPGRRAGRPRRRGLCDAVRAAQGRARPMCRSTPTIRPTGSATSSPTRARRSSWPTCASPTASPTRGVETLVLDTRARRRSPGSTTRRSPTPRRRGAARACATCSTPRARPAPEGRRDRPSEHLQFRPRRRRNLRLRPRRPRLSGHVDRLRLLDRGGVGPARRRRDAGPQHLRDEPVRRGARRLPREPARSPASPACRRCSPRSSASCRSCASS